MTTQQMREVKTAYAFYLADSGNPWRSFERFTEDFLAAKERKSLCIPSLNALIEGTL
jgi:hypothetical protein